MIIRLQSALIFVRKAVKVAYRIDAGLDGVEQLRARLDRPDVLVGLGVALIKRLQRSHEEAMVRGKVWRGLGPPFTNRDMIV
jgi:hypothetical protein